MTTTRKIAKGLSMLCLIGLISIGLNLHVSSVEKVLIDSASSTKIINTTEASNTAAAFPSNQNPATAENVPNDQQGSRATLPDLGIKQLLTPIISQYLAEFLPRLLH